MRERDAAAPLRAIIYARVSSAQQAKDGLPVESQLEQCHAKAAALGAVVVKVFRDEGISGRTTRRPAFQAALNYCDAHPINVFICWSTSRFARNRLDAALNKRLLDKMGVRLCYASQDFGTTDDGWLAEAITEVIDEQVSRQISKDTRRSKAKNANDGFWNGGVIPFGFRSVPEGKRKRLEVVEDEAVKVRLIFRMYISGDGCKSIAQSLNHSGLSKRGRRWTKASVSAVISSPAVVGKIEYQTDGELISTLSHKPIIEQADFDQAIALRGERQPSNVGGRVRSEAAFSGLLKCGHCGEAMMTETATGRGGVRHHYYNCRSFLKGFGCSSQRVRVDVLDPMLLEQIVDRVMTTDNLRDLVTELKMQSTEFERTRQARFDVLGAEAEDVERRLKRLYETVEAGAGLALSDIAPRLRSLRSRQESLRRESEALSAQLAPSVALTEAEAFSAAEVLREMVRDCEDAKATREFLSHIVKNASIRGEEVTLEYWPERLVAAASGSQCVVKWLPDCSTMRTVTLVCEFLRKKAA